MMHATATQGHQCSRSSTVWCLSIKKTLGASGLTLRPSLKLEGARSSQLSAGTFSIHAFSHVYYHIHAHIVLVCRQTCARPKSTVSPIGKPMKGMSYSSSQCTQTLTKVRMREMIGETGLPHTHTAPHTSLPRRPPNDMCLCV